MENLEIVKSVAGLVITFGLVGVITYSIKKLVDFIPTKYLEKILG